MAPSEQEIQERGQVLYRQAEITAAQGLFDAYDAATRKYYSKPENRNEPPMRLAQFRRRAWHQLQRVQSGTAS